MQMAQAQANGQNPGMMQQMAGRIADSPNQVQAEQVMLQGIPIEQRREFAIAKHQAAAANRAQNSQDYSRQLSEQMARFQGQVPNMGMQQRPQQHQMQGSPPGIGGQNGIPMSQSMSPQNTQHFMQAGNQMMQQQQQQMRPNMPGQQSQMTPQQVQQQTMALKQGFFRKLSETHGGQLPPDAETQWTIWRNQQAARQKAQLQAQAQAQMNAARNGQQQPGQGMQRMAANPGMQAQMQAQQQQGAANYQQQLKQQQMAMYRQQQQQQQQINANAMQQGGQQNMMNGMSPGQGGG